MGPAAITVAPVAALLALLSALQWGTADYLAGRLSRTQQVLVVLAGTQLVGLVAMAFTALLTGAQVTPFGYLPWAILASMAGAAGLGLYYRALAIGTMGVVSPIAALGVVVPLLAGLLAGERPSLVADIGIGMAVVGVVLASGPEVRGAAGWAPVVLAGGSACLLGTAMLGIARGSATDLVMTMTAMRVTTVTLLGAVLLLTRAGRRGSAAAVRSSAGAYIVVGLFDVGANLAYGAATRVGMLAIVSVFGSLYPVATILLAWRLDHERLRPVQYAGIAAVLVGAAAISLG